MRLLLLVAAAFAVLGAADHDARPGLLAARLEPTAAIEYRGVLPNAKRQTGTTAPTCRFYMWPGDGATCQEFITLYNITMAQMVYLNPSVGSDCEGFQVEQKYCVRGGASSRPGSNLVVEEKRGEFSLLTALLLASR
jgi:hypothetical protein